MYSTSYADEEKRLYKRLAFWIGGGALALVLVISIWFQGLGVIGLFDVLIRNTGVTLGVLALIAGVVLFLVAFNRGWNLATIIGIGVGAAVLFASPLVFGGYLTAHQYASDVKQVDEKVDYADRAPWTVSNAFASRDQGDIIGDRLAVNYTPAGKDAKAADGNGTSRYTTLIEGRSALGMTGYAGVQSLNMPTTGVIPNDASSYCEFDGQNSGKRLGAFWPWVNLNWSIKSQKPAAHWNKDDAYGYCNSDGDPVVVVPLWKYEGFFFPTKAPNGAMVYTDGTLEHYSAKQLKDEGIAGATYPRSVAAEQRESINGGGSLADWWGSRYGYDTTSKDDEDTNSENEEGNVASNTEFTVITSGEDMEYVTPLNPRGSSQSLTAVSSVQATQTSDGRAPVVVNKNPDLPSTSTLATSIRESSINGDNQWTSRWASGMTIYEILPAQNGHWVASIGQGQAVSYRADIAPDGTIVVTNSDTGQKSGSDNDKESKDSVTKSSGKDLKDMSDEELYNLIHDATDELEERNNSSN